MVTQSSQSSTQGDGVITHSISDALVDPDGRVTCWCTKHALRRTSHTPQNYNRVFWLCHHSTRDDKGCKFFKWDDELPPHVDPEAPPSQPNTSTPFPSPTSTLKRPLSPGSKAMASPARKRPTDYRSPDAKAARMAAIASYNPEVDDRPPSASQPSQVPSSSSLIPSKSPSKFKPVSQPSTSSQPQSQSQASRLPAPDFTAPGSQSTVAAGPSQASTAPADEDEARYWPIELDEVEILKTPRTPAASVRSQGMMTPPASVGASGGGSSQSIALQLHGSPSMGKGKEKEKETPRASRIRVGTPAGNVAVRNEVDGGQLSRSGELQNMIGDIMQVVQAYGGMDVPARIRQLERENAEQARTIEALRAEAKEATESKNLMEDALKKYLLATSKK